MKIHRNFFSFLLTCVLELGWPSCACLIQKKKRILAGLHFSEKERKKERKEGRKFIWGKRKKRELAARK